MRTVTPNDILKFQWPTRPSVSPDGKQVIYEKTVIRSANDDYETQLWLADTVGHASRVLPTLGTTNVNAVWSPDGKTIAFLSNRSLGMQLWLLSPDGGEAQMITRFKNGISSIAFAPDGKKVYGIVSVKPKQELEVFSKDDSTVKAEQLISEEHKKWESNPKRYDNLHYKLDGVGLNKNFKKQLVAIDISSGAYQPLTSDMRNVIEYSVSPDGTDIVFTSIDSADDNPIYSGKLYKVSMDSQEEELLFSNSKATGPAYSPDGRWIAFIGGDKIHRQLFVIPSAGGEASCLSHLYPYSLEDLSISDMVYMIATMKPQWSNDNRFIYALSTFQGMNEIVRFSISAESRPTTVVGGKRTIYHFSYDGEDTIVAAYLSATHPGKLSAINLSKGENIFREFRKPTDEFPLRENFFPEMEVRLDDCNDQLLSDIIVSDLEEFTYDSVDGWKIQGFLLKPTHFDPEKKYPIILDIHGGPHHAYGFMYMHQMQVFSAQGYAVIYVNPRGSAGFGKEFKQSVRGEYGTKDMQDILHGVDEAIKRYEFLDENRVAVNGLSYGGFMTNWLITHTDRFFAAVSEGSISNWISMYGTSDISPKFIDMEFSGKTDPETLWKTSPLAYVNHVQTPTLLIHAENDLRCPIEQSEQFYSYIKRQGKKVEFLRFPNSSHILLQIGEPSKRIQRLEAMVEWFNQHLPE